MDKYDMRAWIISLEAIIDDKLKKWKKENKMENGEAVQMRWQWEQTHFQLDIFWQDGQEAAVLTYLSPRVTHTYRWSGLNSNTFSKVMDRVGNLAQITLHPPIDPYDKVGY